MTLPFGGEPCTAERPRFAILPVPYERTTTYRKGTAAGPQALLAASAQVELYEEETGLRPLDAGVWTLDPLVERGMPDALAPRIEEAWLAQQREGRLVGLLGGEHSISLGAIRAAARCHPGLGILQVDAHPDLRDSYEGTRFGHGCVMRRALDDPSIAALVQVGLRAISPEDEEATRADPRIRPFRAHRISGRPREAWIAEVLDALPERVYLTFDLDGLDPSVIPGTGTPEPGGLGWWEALALLREVCRWREIVGFDVVELLPEPPSAISDFAAAHLVFKILAYLQQRPRRA